MSSNKLTIPVATVDPVADAGGLQLYCKDVTGVKQLFSRASDGTIVQLTPGVPGPPGPAGGAVIFDDSVPATDVNIRSNRASNQSPVDNTKAQITNLGSQDHVIDGAATGATGIGSTIGGGDDNTTSGDYSTVPGGAGNQATGTYSHASGFKSRATTPYAYCEGRQGFSHGTNGSHVEGWLCEASGNDGPHAGGSGSLASGNTAFAQGDGCTASGNASAALCSGTTASGLASMAINDGCTAAGDASFAQGASNVTAGYSACALNSSFCSADYALAHGWTGSAIRKTQHAHASGRFFANGDAQTSVLVMRGHTPGAAINENTELLYSGRGLNSGSPNYGTDQLILEDGKGYAFKITLSAGGTQIGGTVRVSRSIELTFNARRDTGVTTITATGANTGYGDAATATWTLTPTVGAAPDRIVLTFDTGAGLASLCHVAGRVEFTEVAY